MFNETQVYDSIFISKVKNSWNDERQVVRS